MPCRLPVDEESLREYAADVQSCREYRRGGHDKPAQGATIPAPASSIASPPQVSFSVKEVFDTGHGSTGLYVADWSLI